MEKYSNPIKKQGDFADPYMIRYNGRYYLYCTNPDISCWSSVDLLNWKLEGPSIEPDEFPGLVPFAPEVVYWNGAFYMYTSPHGYGHYVLRSASPTGPFRKISGNVAHNIDGSIMIDDDGQWYFYWADDSGILGCKMKSPTEFGEPVNTGAFMHGWTEGPFVLKQNGKYYMTYTGNHYLSSGYRINAAVSDHPLKGYIDDPHNPIVIHTEGENIGLGHSCTVLGPDLKSHYMVYHNFNPDATRHLNIDYQCWHGLSTQIYGPTRLQQAAPQLPDFSDDAEGASSEKWQIIKGGWNCEDHFYQVAAEGFLCVSKKGLGVCGVVETNLKLTGNADRYGIVFGWIDSDKYYKVTFSFHHKEVQLLKMNQGEECCLIQSRLPEDYDEAALHCLRLVCDGTSLVISIDNRKQMEAAIQTIEGGVGYFAASGGIAVGFTAFSNGTAAEAEKELYKPVPGEFPACTALGETGEQSREGSITLTDSQQLLYHLNIETSGNYTVDLFGNFPEDTQWQIIIDGSCVVDQSFRIKENGILSICTELPEGLHTLGLFLQKGRAKLKRIGLYKNLPVISERKRTITEFGPYGKHLWGEDGWSDYKINANLKVSPESERSQAGILFRVSEPSEGGEGKDPVLGTNFFRGYFVGLSSTHITLSKHSYDEQILSEKEWEVNLEEMHRISVSVSGDTFSVFTDDCSDPIIAYHDEVPFTHGRIGVRTKNANLKGTIIINGL